MDVFCRIAHRRFWQVEERFVDSLGIIEYWVCALCHRRWTLTVPPSQTLRPPKAPAISE